MEGRAGWRACALEHAAHVLQDRALYEKAGLPEPTPDLTWAQYFEQAKALVQDTDKDGKANAWAVDTYFIRDALTPTIWQTIFNANGGELLDDAGQPSLDNENGVNSLKTFIQLLDYAPPGATGHGFSKSLQAFRQGQVATMFTWGSVFKGTAVDTAATTLTTKEVGIQVLPVGSVSAGAHRGIWSATLSSKTDELEASSACAAADLQGRRSPHLVGGQFVPARKSTLSSTPSAEWQAPVFKTLQNAYDVAAAGQMWRIRSPKSDAAQQIFADGNYSGPCRTFTAITPEEALKVASDRIAEVLK